MSCCGDITGAKRALVALALAFGTFMQVLDTSIANVAIPTIAGNLGVSTDQGTWVITSFAVSNGICVPLTGWLMQRYGAVKTFAVSVLAFTVASLLCGISWSLPSLVVFRVLQGAVSGPMIPGSQALLLMLFPPERKGTALAIWSITTLVAPVTGPVLGGYVSDNWTWPWIFYINIPVGVFASTVCYRYLKHYETPTRRLPIDTVGLGLLALWVGSLQIMLDKGKDLDWFNSTPILVMTLVAAVTFVAWLIWELTERYPMVDLSLLKYRNFRIGTIGYCLGYAVFFGNIVLFPLWLQTQLGYTATWAGLVAAPAGVISILISPLVGRFVGKSDARWLASIGFLSFAASYFLRARLTADASFFEFILPQLVLGVGMGTFFISLLAISLDGLPADRVPAASGLGNFLRTVAAAFATSITTTFWDRHESLHQTHLAESSSLFSPTLQSALSGLQSAGINDPTVAAGAITQGLVHQAYLLSSLDYFWISGWITLLPVALLWFAHKPKGAGPAVAAE
ncbi:MAG TPA: DHA2 family efflux MFS transporter permease subunit [Steroidobacteraceae bacterium]|jgi:DHA2 family multidrug resistance protein|nr:DHA2 family efflux MFS transporter permease subunit [Steroidobacteraceae bacterium]